MLAADAAVVINRSSHQIGDESLHEKPDLLAQEAPNDV
jgi:hypothetical protein